MPARRGLAGGVLGRWNIAGGVGARMARPTTEPSSRNASQRARPASAPARHVVEQQQEHRHQYQHQHRHQQHQQHQQQQQQPQSDMPGSERERPGSAVPRQRPCSSTTRPGSNRGQRACSARPYPSRPSSARTVAGATTRDQYDGWAADARAALDRRAATPVGRTSYFANDRTGRWRGLGRAQWAWHNHHGHSALAMVQEQRPWEPRPVKRTPIVADPHARTRTDIKTIGAAFAETVLCAVEFTKEEGDNWRNATPTRMLGTTGVSERGWSKTGGVSAAKALRGRSTHVVARRTMDELEKFERRMRGKPDEDFPSFPGLETQASYVDSSDEENEACGASHRMHQQRDGVRAGSRRPPVSRPPSASRRGAPPGRIQMEVRHLHRLHMAAVVIQRVSRGLLVRRRLRA